MKVTLPLGVGLLHAAQVVLVRRPPASTASSPLAVAVPEVHGAAGKRRAAGAETIVSSIVSGTPRRTAEPAEARADVAAHDAGLVEHVGPFEPSPGNGPGSPPGTLVHDPCGIRGSKRSC